MSYTALNYPLSIAPMMDWTDRYYRFIMRAMTKKTILYTEMITAQAILFGNPDEILEKDEDNPVVLQLGGNNPNLLAKALKISIKYGYNGFNLNVGCPSDKVSGGNFGACLMAFPELVAECVAAMKEATNLPVSVKHRIGINGKESYEDLARFVQIVHERGGCNHFIVHARIAILGGLSPKENRSIPPLRYEDVFQLKKDFPHLRIEINGGISSLENVKYFLKQGVDGVMIGRAAYENPSIFLLADSFLESKEENNYVNQPKIKATDFFCSSSFVKELTQYLEKSIEKGAKVHHILRHTLGFFHGVPGSRKYRQFLSDRMYKEPFNPYLYQQALEYSGILKQSKAIITN